MYKEHFEKQFNELTGGRPHGKTLCIRCYYGSIVLYADGYFIPNDNEVFVLLIRYGARKSTYIAKVEFDAINSIKECTKNYIPNLQKEMI